MITKFYELDNVRLIKMEFCFSLLSSAAVTVTATQSIPPKIISSITKTMAAVHMARPSSPYASSSSDNDSINAPTGTALRRLYFQTGKSSKITNGTNNKTTIPKVIVKNSSCNSTINTSTDSASTHLTNVTTATDTETFDSLDSGKFLFYFVY